MVNPEPKVSAEDRRADPQPDLQAQGGCQPPIVCMGAVIANAIHDAIGVRVFDLPMTPERVLEAIKKG